MAATAATASFTFLLDLGDFGVDFRLVRSSEAGLAATQASTNFCQKK